MKTVQVHLIIGTTLVEQSVSDSWREVQASLNSGTNAFCGRLHMILEVSEGSTEL